MPKLISSTEFYELSAQFGQFNYRVAKMTIVDRLICIGIFKSLPVFPKLDINDQVCYYYYLSIGFFKGPLGVRKKWIY